MMKNGLIVSIFLLSTLWIACASNKAQSDNSILKGSLVGLGTNQLYLIDVLQAKSGPVDTAYVDEKGNFAFDYQPEMKAFYRVTISENVNLILPLAANEQVVVSGDAMSSGGLVVEGTADALRMMEFNQFLQTNYAEQQGLNQEFQNVQAIANRDSIIEVFREKYTQIEQKKYDKIKELIDADPALFANIALMEQLPAENPEHIPYYKKVRDALEPNYSASPFFQSLDQKIAKASRFMPGTDVPEINLPDPNGNVIPLSSLRGKVVLIDFWASWCKPCRRENPNVVAAYEKYKDKGFTVYGVSLDRNKEAWVNAIAQDNLTWTHVSDLKFWSSIAAQDYGISAIPFAVLIDENGKVIGKNLRGPALHNTLEKVLN